MREITASPRVTITLGKQGENAAVLVIFPIAGWEELYGHGSKQRDCYFRVNGSIMPETKAGEEA